MNIAQKTKVTRQDLKIYPSERLTQTDDGGGMPTGKPLTGALNELFKPISSIARLNGAFYAVLEYMGVLRPDDEPLIGAFAAITRPPKDPTVSYLLAKAYKFGESRAEAINRIESYVVETIESKMTLLSTQTTNSRIIQVYQRPGESLPLIGDVYCLKQDKKGYPFAKQFVQVTRIVKSEDRTFTSSQNKDFVRTVIQLEISSKLEVDFIGVDYPSETYVDNPCKLRETTVADAADYYGVKPIVEAIKKDVMQIKIASLMEQIVPTSQVSTPLNDLTAAGQTQTLFDGTKAGTDGIVSLAVNKQHNISTVSTIYFGNAITPSTIIISTSQGDITDKGGTLYQNAVEVGTVDYANGFATINAIAFSGYLSTAKFRPSANTLKVANTARIPVDINSRSDNYSITIDPPPAMGTLQASYRSQNKWYTLRDDGSGKLLGASAQHGSGSINLATGTATISLTELPDVGSSILWSWGAKVDMFNRSTSSPVTKMVMQLATSAVGREMVLSWEHNGAKTAVADSAGRITGDWTGYFDSKSNQIVINTDSSFSHPNTALDVTVQYAGVTGDSNRSESITLTVDGSGIATGKITNGIPVKGSLSLSFAVCNPATNEQVGTVSVGDDGSGNLINDKGENKGTIDYVAGDLRVDTNTAITISTPIYKQDERLASSSMNVYGSA